MSRLLLLALALCAPLIVSPAQAAQIRASLPDIEDEVMCPTCGVALAEAFSPQAERERRFIRRQIEQGRTKQQIEQALVAEFGPDVLATPRKHGFDLTAYIVPAVVVAVAAVLVILGLIRWRRRARAPLDSPPRITPDDASRVDRDLSRYEP